MTDPAAPHQLCCPRSRPAIDAVRPVGSIFSVQPPTVTSVAVSLTIAVAPGSAKAPVQSLVADSISAYINSLPIGAGLPLTRLAQLAYSASATVVNVSAVTVNGATSDVVVSPSGVMKAWPGRSELTC